MRVTLDWRNESRQVFPWASRPMSIPTWKLTDSVKSTLNMFRKPQPASRI
jgi:hypothetical protein